MAQIGDHLQTGDHGSPAKISAAFLCSRAIREVAFSATFAQNLLRKTKLFTFYQTFVGIRVDEEALERQLTLANCQNRAEFPFQKAILEKKLPYTIGGGIGQSRICMFYLRKAHIGEIQASIWPDEVRELAEKAGIPLL